MEAKRYVELLFPNGRAYSSNEDSEKFNEFLALQIERIMGWIEDYQDQLWYNNENFNSEPWEKRYDIDVPDGATLEERRQVVKSYMMFPQSDNRLSLDYIQSQLNLAGFTGVIVERNPLGDSIGILHGNNITLTESFSIGAETYNSFKITGTIDDIYREKMLLLLMSIKPLDSAVYDTTQGLALALNDSFALALSDTLALALN